ncbi:hypothetical protein [Amantichitinum ursilacus]|uniref:Uncharacterized protein n=1 Tax=Amantichitinum ursilacus TaxID=857265 RepID=A0A0N0GN96_9NEIS|nr:hypothetical protein [Amantichitinum ursilacus]KPC52240.1 hypothetical protein WG78_14310 [Amantichitinum ursilacus]
MIPDELTRWQRVIDGGWWRCVLWNGVVCWGVPLTVLLSAVRTLTGISGSIISELLRTFPFGLAAGFVYGLALWGYAQLQIVKARHKKD